MGVWKRARLHPDCHVVVESAFYSAPHRLIGERLWTRATAGEVVIYHDDERIATHRRVAPGGRSTDPAHYPPHKVAILLATPACCRGKAATIGPAAAELVGRLLDDRPLDRLRSVQAVLRLAEKHGERRLDRACRRALCFEDLRYSTVKRILVNGLESEPVSEFLSPAVPRPPSAYAFARCHRVRDLLSTWRYGPWT